MEITHLKMIKYKCPNCKREKETEEKQVLILCSCGYEMEILKNGFKKN